jgi:LacI family transcriptional regulator
MTITLKRVASEAGVSYQTVWRALHDAPGILPGTRTQVLEVASRLGYRRNVAASTLRTSRTNTIGLIVLDVENRFTSQLVGGVEAAATEGGYSVLLMNSADDVVRERRAVHALTGRQVDGIILNPSSDGDHSYLLRDLPAGLPLVSINRPIPGVPSATVESRHTDVALAAERLVEQGHRWIGGIFGEEGNTPFLHRRQALQRALGVIQGCSPLWFRHGPNTSAFARETIKAMLAPIDRPTALFVGGNRLTEGVLLGLRDLGLRQGIDLAVVGFDLPYAGLLDPPMPVLLQPARDMGRLAVDTLFAMRNGRAILSPRPLPLALDIGIPGDRNRG